MGEKILNMRKARGWNQEELAEHIGVTRQAVSRWESNSAKPDADKIVAICELFGVSADYLLRDQHAGQRESIMMETEPATTSTKMTNGMTLRQWVAFGVMLVGVSVMFLLKIIHVLKDTNYAYYSSRGFAYSGFIAFLKYEELELVWYIAIAGVLSGLFYLVIWPAVRKYIDSARRNAESN